MRTKKKILTLVLILSSNIIFCQYTQSYITQKSKGIFLGYGFINELLPENYYYKILQFIYNYSIPILNQQNVNKHNLLVQFEPQLNPVFIKRKKMEIELGTNVGLLYNYKLTENLLLDIGIGSGFHFISIRTNLQARGFIFSDNFILGISKRLKSKKGFMEFSIQTRFRHISNAGLKEPNTGIDNFIILTGLSKVF